MNSNLEHDHESNEPVLTDRLPWTDEIGKPKGPPADCRYRRCPDNPESSDTGTINCEGMKDAFHRMLNSVMCLVKAYNKALENLANSNGGIDRPDELEQCIGNYEAFLRSGWKQVQGYSAYFARPKVRFRMLNHYIEDVDVTAPLKGDLFKSLRDECGLSHQSSKSSMIVIPPA